MSGLVVNNSKFECTKHLVSSVGVMFCFNKHQKYTSLESNVSKVVSLDMDAAKNTGYHQMERKTRTMDNINVY